MISFTADYARLLIERDLPFDDVTESVRSVLHICHVNRLPAALVVSEQHALDWRSSHRVALRFVSSRWKVDGTKLALVVVDGSADIHDDVQKVAAEAGFDCRIFDHETKAVEWLTKAVAAERPPLLNGLPETC